MFSTLTTGLSYRPAALQGLCSPGQPTANNLPPVAQLGFAPRVGGTASADQKP